MISGTITVPATGFAFNVNFLKSKLDAQDYGQNYIDALVNVGPNNYNSANFVNYNIDGDYSESRNSFYSDELSQLPATPAVGDVVSFSYSKGQKIQRLYTYTGPANGWQAVQEDDSNPMRISINGR